MSRLHSTSGELARRGFEDAASASRDLDELGERNDFRGPGFDPGPRWLDIFSHAASPDLAIAGLNRIDEAAHDRVRELGTDRATYARLVAVLGGSEALNRHLCAHPEDLPILCEEPRRHTREEILAELGAAVGVDHSSGTAVAADPGAADALRLANKAHLMRIAARDLTSPEGPGILEDVAGELADLADGIIECALAISRSQVTDHEHCRLGIVAMGKCGAQELNYISDIDVIFVAEPADDQTSSPRAVEIGTKLAAKLSQICSAHAAGGSIWQVDANLRPDGKSGPLVRTLSSMQTYYDKWAKNWEFQAMLKARPMAGDLELAQAFVEIVAPKVWQAAERDHFLSDTQAMRQRVISLIPANQADREIKLGSGGLRDVEFSVQLLQLVHGRADDRIRQRGTLPALAALVAHGYIGREDGAQMAEAYRFQRTLEHRIQLYRLRRTHLLPDDEPTQRVIARSLGIRGEAGDLVAAWRQSARTVQRLHQRVFYSPLLAAVTRISTDGLRLTPDQAKARLQVLGFSDPTAALRHIEALTNGVSRQSEIQRQLMPAMLGWFAEGANPDHGLLSFRTVSESLGSSPWYLRALRDEGDLAERLAHLLSSSRFAVDLLQRAPETVRLLASDEELQPRSRRALHASMLSAARRHAGAPEAIASVRAIRHAELLRLAAGDILGVTCLDTLGRGLSDLAGATIDATLHIVARDMDHPPRIGVIAMGRWGGGEMSLGSDCDAMFVCDDSDDPEHLKRAGQMIQQVRQMLAARGPDPALPIDPDLRPEGKNGPMVRSVSSYAAYYARWSATWEAQALVRAAHGAGDEDLTAEVLAMADALRWPEGGLERSQLAEIRKLKARMEVERIPRGTDPKRNTKLGPGGLSDVEWTVQVLQLQHAHEVPALRTPSTMGALAAACEAGLVGDEDREALEEAWRFASRLRNKIMLTRGRASDVIPTDAREMAAIAGLLGYQGGQATQMIDDWRRSARHAGRVVDDIFWERT